MSLQRRTELGPGRRALERGSTFDTSKPRKPLKRTTELKADPSRARPRRQAISPASKEQREKVKNGICVVSGMKADEAALDPAHLWPRGLGGCDAADCVVPLRRDLHTLFDFGKLDLLPWLIAHGCWVEIGHMVAEHHVDPISLLKRLTGGEVEVTGACELPGPPD